MPQAHDLPTPDLYTPTATEPTTLTDPPAAHGAHGVSSEAAQQLALVIHDSFIRTTDFELSMNRIAMMFDAFAAQAVAAREAQYNAQYIHDLESDDKVDKAVEADRERIIKELTPLYNAARDTWKETYEDEEGADERYAEMKAYEKASRIVRAK